MGKKELEKKMMYLENEMHNLKLLLSLDKARDVLKSKLELQSKVIDILGFNEDSFKYVQIGSVDSYFRTPELKCVNIKYYNQHIRLDISSSDANTIIDYMTSIKW